MNLEDAAALLPLHRPSHAPEGRLQKAVQMASRDPELSEKLASQTHFDSMIGEVLRSISPPENLRAKLRDRTAAAREGAPPPKLRAHAFNPAVLTAILGVLVIAGFFVWTVLERMEKFGGRESVERMLTSTGHMTGVELDPVSGAAGKLGDWFYMRGFEGFTLPAELATLPVLGSRLFHQDGHGIAQMAVDRNNSIVSVFRASDFGIDVPSDQPWRVLEQDDWVGALRRHDDLCYLLAFRGDKAQMQKFLDSLKTP